MSFTAAIFDDPPLPSFPSAYGYNTLLLSNTSSAKLDTPFHEYVRTIQERLVLDESYSLTADVYATVTSYNDSVESHRHDYDFWNIPMASSSLFKHFSAAMNTFIREYFAMSNTSNKCHTNLRNPAGFQRN